MPLVDEASELEEEQSMVENNKQSQYLYLRKWKCCVHMLTLVHRRTDEVPYLQIL